MFRRKKSTQDAPHHSISISAPMRMAPPSQIAQTTSPVFDKFAKTTPRPNGGWMNPSNVYPEVRGVNGESCHESLNQFPLS